MKKTGFLLTIFFGFSFNFAQNSYKEKIENNHNFYNGYINEKAKIKVTFDSVIPEEKKVESYKVTGSSDVEGSKSDFEGTITFNSDKTKKFKDWSLRFYVYTFTEKGSGKHNGIFTGDIIINELNKVALISFEGKWENYDKNLKFPVYFNNSNKMNE